ncbi:MAG: hypothetical protein JST00_31455 [Deltaproteobacteria bacterium]|nr:hypothetical protein [Deltaproteobacteria bacterium]
MAALTGAAASAAAASGASKSTATLSSVKATLWAKVVFGLAVVVGGAVLVSRRSDTPPQPVATIGSVQPPPPRASVEPISPPRVMPEAPSSPVVAASALPSAAREVRTEPAATPEVEGASSADPLVYEARLLEAARACLAAADVECARTRLNEHARIERPRLRDEAAVMNIETLRAEGRRDDARKAAATFLERHPESPYVKRVRAIVRQLEEDGR